ncbi:mycofactocin-coupled SDR family oxidoreductase [Gordonia rubripertincta]|uniref:Mycofactocin-coupled SDR family oxidoreductase n=1 Tax=Gordonia rubripertincta TaxID=36822 RepID=A0ABT4MNL9_GORRU|nr:mycofactocin-coupled SDR family oxidoreductase [Gordonia rubripertincta]MCZ4548601.1 mycofactocin-coupled SDR family oxidoreductase [Gordonia rubripertincta]
MGSLSGQVVIVTGGARGQGRSHAQAAAERGADVVLVDRCSDNPAIKYPLGTKDDLAHTEGLVRATGSRALSIVCDVSDFAQTVAMVDEVIATFGRIDVLVANAGVHGGGSIQDADVDVWDEVIGSNLSGVFHCLRAVSPHMIAQNYGRIVVTASNQGRVPVPGSVAYVASKWGVIGLVKAAALDLAQFGVTVNAVAPGNTSTPMVHNAGLYRALRPDLTDPQWSDVEPLLLEHHVQPVALLEPEEITAAVMFLIGSDTPHITGSVLDVNAGTSARSSA